MTYNKYTEYKTDIEDALKLATEITMLVNQADKANLAVAQMLIDRHNTDKLAIAIYQSTNGDSDLVNVLSTINSTLHIIDKSLDMIDTTLLSDT